MKLLLVLCLFINVAVAQISVGVTERVKSITASTTALITDDNIFADATSGNILVTLPSAASKKGKVLKIYKTDSTTNTLTVGSNVLRGQGFVTNTSNGTSWQSIPQLTNSISNGPAGNILEMAVTACPTGTLYTDGTAVNRTTYALLYAAIGTTWGVGDGSTTFNLPDLRGLFLRGDGASTINARTKTGPSVGAKQEDQIQGHFHAYSDPGHQHGAYVSDSTGGTGAWSTASFTINGQHLGMYMDVMQTIGTGITISNPSTDGSNGTPRVGAETRPANAGVKRCISTGL